MFDTPQAQAEPEGQASAAQADGMDKTSQREMRVREAAFRRYEQRGDAMGDPLGDWFAAEAEIDAADADGSGARQQDGMAAAGQRNADDRA